MPSKQGRVLDALNLELYYLENGGYGSPVRDDSRKERSIFLNSPLCLNKLPEKGAYPSECCFLPCSKCWLMDFIPDERRFEAVPCHHIPLNQSGETLADMEGPQHDLKVHEMVSNWLRARKRELEVSGPQAQPPQLQPTPMQSQAKTV